MSEAIKYTYKWEPNFKKSLRYKKPFIINGYELNDWFAEEQEELKLRGPPMDEYDLSMPITSDMSSDE